MLRKINDKAVGVLARFQRDEGQALAEYGLILALIAAVAVAALTALGLAISGGLNNVTAGF